jgi:hypothetical protein
VAEAGCSRFIDASRFRDEPELMMWQRGDVSLGMSVPEVERIQLAGLRKRFDELRGKLSTLSKLADAQGVDRIETINDAAPLLFRHTTYKSYPVSLIDRNRFDLLTAWLGNLTIADLSPVRTQGLASIDDWLDALKRDAGVRIIHSTGTSGKLSFVPRTQAERQFAVRSFRLNFEVAGRPEPVGMDQMPMVVIGYRHMYNGYGANIDAMMQDLYKGDESKLIVQNPGRLSADLLSLGGRLSAANAKGDLGRAQIAPVLLARQAEFIEEQKQAPARRAAFYDAIAEQLRGKKVLLSANWSMLYEMAEQGRTRGLNRVFSPDSLVMVAGGTKGKVLPPDFRRQSMDFLGVETIAEGYGMSELTGLMPKCGAGKYHLKPWLVGYLLDPETGQPAPRSGTHTGRFGAIDLIAQTYWGGFLSGDEVTMTYGKCACGNSGTFVDDAIRRYSEKEGGDDKINCAGAPEAHDRALAFLSEIG